MIQIKKSAEAPEKLVNEGISETKINKQLFEQFEDEFRSGDRKFEFKNTIYGHETVKSLLRTIQHEKCCFCERKEEIGDVEHFRPKAAYRQKRGEQRSQVGYYWLAYDWNNLFFCCPKCNRRYKENLFPLADESKRAKSHSDDICSEKPLFINPQKDNPEYYIEYHGITPHSINNNPKGKITIKETGINRPFLDERRLDKYKVCKMLYQFIHSPGVDDETKNEFEVLLNEHTQDSAEFASMIRCAVRDKFRF